jgi:prefoldin subunit 5
MKEKIIARLQQLKAQREQLRASLNAHDGAIEALEAVLAEWETFEGHAEITEEIVEESLASVI